MSTVEIPSAILRHTDDLPWVDLGDGSILQLLQVDIDQGLWVIRTKFKPGMTVQTHKHTGPVYAFTMTGSWKYLEYPDDVNLPGSYLFEPAGSIHTLHVPESNSEDTDVFFAIHGANLNLDEDGNVTYVIDAGGILEYYLALCEADGHPRPQVIGAP